MTDVDIVELLQRQLAAGQSLQDSVSELAQADPKLAPIVQLLAQREQDAQRDLEQDDQQVQLEQQELELLEEHRRQGAVLREHLDEITAELGALRDRLADLAGALGACPACFGEDRSCWWCRGRGVPGFMPPEPAGFDRLVMPALQLHARLHGRRTTEVDSSATQERSA
jgi:uncharacterized membrane protein YccC